MSSLGEEFLASIGRPTLSDREQANAHQEPSRYAHVEIHGRDTSGYLVTVDMLACKDCGCLVHDLKIHDSRCAGREQTRIR